MLVFHKAKSRLIWGEDEYKAVSGPYGLGPLPDGFYEVLRRNVVAHGLGAPYQDPESGLNFFIPLNPLFDTHRSGFGIHPDGNTPGTLGCIGLKSSIPFWEKWTRTPMALRPELLHVESRVIDAEKVDGMLADVSLTLEQRLLEWAREISQ